MSHRANFLIVTTLSIVFIIFVAHNTNQASAITLVANGNTTYYTSHYNLIGVQLSPTCLALIKNHMPTFCPTYDTIKQFDNTNPLWAGQWVNSTYYHRLLPRVSNHYVMNPNPFEVMVDPDPNFTTMAKMIIIQAGNFTYINPDETIGNNHTRNEYQNRFVSSCSQAIVAPIPWLINDTINYLESNCKTTKYNEKITIITKDTPFDYSNPYSSMKQQNMLKEYGITISGEKHLMGGHTIKIGNCINIKCDIKDPYKKKGW